MKLEASEGSMLTARELPTETSPSNKLARDKSRVPRLHDNTSVLDLSYNTPIQYIQLYM